MAHPQNSWQTHTYWECTWSWSYCGSRVSMKAHSFKLGCQSLVLTAHLSRVSANFRDVWSGKGSQSVRDIDTLANKGDRLYPPLLSPLSEDALSWAKRLSFRWWGVRGLTKLNPSSFIGKGGSLPTTETLPNHSNLSYHYTRPERSIVSGQHYNLLQTRVSEESTLKHEDKSGLAAQNSHYRTSWNLSQEHTPTIPDRNLQIQTLWLAGEG